MDFFGNITGPRVCQTPIKNIQFSIFHTYIFFATQLQQCNKFHRMQWIRTMWELQNLKLSKYLSTFLLFSLVFPIVFPILIRIPQDSNIQDQAEKLLKPVPRKCCHAIRIAGFPSNASGKSSFLKNAPILQ